jgi:hypothetical protein
MSRKPVDVLAARAKGALNGRDAIWAAIREHPESFTCRSVADATRQHPDTVRTYINCLLTADIVEFIGGVTIGDDHARRSARMFRLVADMGAEAPRIRRDGSVVTQGLAREQMWRSIRILKTFSLADLVILGSTETVQINEEDARSYCRHLVKAGYLMVDETRVFQLVPTMNTGPLPPQIQRTKAVWDANRRKVMWAETEAL